MIEIKVPQLAESINEGTIAKWLKKEGDVVQAGDILLELETDKVNLEINAEEDGILKERLKQEGETVFVGEVIARMAEAGESTPAEPKASTEAKGVESAESKGEVSEQQTDETLKARPTPPVTSEPPLKPIHSPPIQTVPPTRPPLRERIAPSPIDQPAGPAARRRARRQGVELSAPDEQDDRPVERIPMSRRRQTIAKRLVEAQQTAAMLTTFNEVDMSAIMALRKKRQEAFLKEHGVKLGYMSFFTKAVVGALKKFPLLNAEIVGNEILVKKYYDIGVAVSTDQGLVVPVVRDADKLSFAQIEQEIASLAEKARQNKLSLEELQGGTFTITNGGVFGSLLSTPILNPPQVGILGMHKIQLRPVAIDEDRYENRPMMYIALSYDHRIVDGREAVSFLVKVKEMLEDPETLLLEG